MTQEGKKLLIKDLCGRVPYVTFVYVERNEAEEMLLYEGCEDDEEEPNIHTLISCDYYGECDLDDNLYETVYNIKPYLRSMSSMTGKETIEWHEITVGQRWVTFDNVERCVEWLNAHHFDYRGLIGKGLALEAPNDMYKTKIQ